MSTVPTYPAALSFFRRGQGFFRFIMFEQERPFLQISKVKDPVAGHGLLFKPPAFPFS